MRNVDMIDVANNDIDIPQREISLAEFRDYIGRKQPKIYWYITDNQICDDETPVYISQEVECNTLVVSEEQRTITLYNDKCKINIRSVDRIKIVNNSVDVGKKSILIKIFCREIFSLAEEYELDILAVCQK